MRIVLDWIAAEINFDVTAAMSLSQVLAPNALYDFIEIAINKA